MPSLNALGEWCAGIGGAPASWGSASGVGTFIPGGLSADWLTNDLVVVQDCTATCVLKTYNVRTGVSATVAPRGANVLSAGGGVWAAWLGGFGLFTSSGLLLPGAYLGSGGPEGSHGSVGPDGAVAVKRYYHASGPYDVHEVGGLTWQLTAGAASYPQLLGGHRAVWSEGGNPRVAGACPQPNPMTRPYGWLTMIPPPTPADPDGWWCLYQDSSDRLLLHPVTSTAGYVVAPAGSATFRPALVRLSPTSIRVVWATNEGESPDAIVVATIDLGTTRTVLGSAVPPDWIEPIDPPEPPDPVGPTGRPSVVAKVPPRPRVYPHVDGITDWRAQQSVRLLWDQAAALTSQVEAAHASLTELSATMASQAEVDQLRKAVGEALAIAQQAALSGSVGADGGPATGPGSKGEPIVPMSADPAVCEDQIKRSLAYYGRTDFNYWAIQIHLPGPWQGGDKKWYMGWDAYFEKRAAPGDTGSADHALLPLPAVHQDPVPAGYPPGGWT